jgi:oligosaccharide repeat unit polymerase
MEAWIFMISAWILLYLGSAVIIIIRHLNGDVDIKSKPSDFIGEPNESLDGFINILKILIIVLSILGTLSIVSYWIVLTKTFGNIVIALAQTALWYHLRVRGDITQGIPYLSSLILVCCLFAGIYSGVKGKITFLSIIPLVLIIIYSILSMGRAAILIAITLYITSHLTSYKYFNTQGTKSQTRKWIITIAIIVVLAMFSAEQIRALRRIGESYKRYGENKSMSVLRNTPFLTPSVYFYLSGEPVVLSEYIQKNREQVPTGWYTFAPIYRILAKMGLTKKPPYVQPFYLIPAPMNTGTYLRELHADFGIAGVVLFPFLLGLVCSILILSRSYSVTKMIVLAHLYVYTVMTFICNAIGLGNWLISFLVSFFLAQIIDRYFHFFNKAS